MKPYLLGLLRCDRCSGALIMDGSRSSLVCQVCGHKITLHPVEGAGHLIPLFTQPPPEMLPSEKMERGPGLGTPWRQANWRFVQVQADRMPQGSLILDVGAGRGDFAAAMQYHRPVALEVYPYPEVDVVCDLTQVNPFQADSFDAIFLLNVLEHVYDTHALLATLAGLLKPGGRLVMAIPFMVKIHQAPIDFVRYTHFALQRLGENHNLRVKTLEGYYDPVFFLGEGIGNLRWTVIPTLHGIKRYLARAVLLGMRTLTRVLGATVPTGNTHPPAQARSMAPTGYHVVYEKYASQTDQSSLS